jgi:hypothetical protein
MFVLLLNNLFKPCIVKRSMSGLQQRNLLSSFNVVRPTSAQDEIMVYAYNSNENARSAEINEKRQSFILTCFY